MIRYDSNFIRSAGTEQGDDPALAWAADELDRREARITTLESTLRVIAGQKCFCDAEDLAKKALEGKG